MFLVIISLVAVAAAQVASPYPPYAPHSTTKQGQTSGLNDGGFLSGFSEQMEQLGRDMQHLQLELAKVTPTIETTQTQYIVTYQLPGFHKEDIEVKIKEGMLVVEAVQRNGMRTRSQTNMRNLPEYVNRNGSWAFIGEILRIVFPLKINNEQPNMNWSRGQNVGNTQGTGQAPVGNTNMNTNEPKKHAIQSMNN
ncbi:uncharacterized protein LOC115456025 [Manduca sexta]|uniref:uncharacterized protein LOC115456025 n=1 Tax=Manduca sexta TaxID=7130 RepID=UPI00188DE4DD|nr:uncharacterized protein LOC115456025 [Manduca sexta]